MKVEMQLREGRIWVRSPYSPILVQRFGLMPGRKFEGKENGNAWSFPACKDIVLMLADVCGLIVEYLPEPIKALVGRTRIEPEVLDMSLIDNHAFRTNCFHHQRENLVRLIANDRWLIADEQGTGKTHAVCNVLSRMTHYGDWPRGFRALILCPKSVCSGWKAQLQEHGGIVCSQVIVGSPDERRAMLRPGGSMPVQITNYEAVLHTREFQDVQWSVIVLDEIQKIKNFTASSSRAVRKLTDKAPMVYGLSGTPAPNGLQDWLGIIAAIRPDLAPKSSATGEITKGAFEERFVMKSRVGDNGPWVVSGYRNVEELHDIIQSFTSRNTKADCLDLPGKVYLTRSVALEGEQKRIYQAIKRDAVAHLKSLGTMITVRNILTESLRLMQVTGGFVKDDDGNDVEIEPKAKMEALAEVIEECGDKQVVVWCAFRAEVAATSAMLGEWGKVETLTGEHTQNARAVAIDNFRKGDARYFVATAAAGGTGVNGLQVADVEVFYSRSYNLAEYLQAQDRLDRLGQQNKVSVYKLLAEGTIDCKVDAVLDNKEDLQSMLLRRPEEMF